MPQSRQNPRPLKSWQAYLLAGASPIFAYIAMRILPSDVENELVAVIFVIPIVFSAYCGGLVAGLIATGASCLLCDYTLIQPRYSFAIESSIDAWRLAALGVIGIILSGFHEWLYRTRLRT